MELANFYLIVAFYLLVTGVGLVAASVGLFGPKGLLVVWGKAEYVPIQFQKVHKEQMKLFGQPLRPEGLPLGRRLDVHPSYKSLPKTLALPADAREKHPHVLVLGLDNDGRKRLLQNMLFHDVTAGVRNIVIVDGPVGLAGFAQPWAEELGTDEYGYRRIQIKESSEDLDVAELMSNADPHVQTVFYIDEFDRYVGVDLLKKIGSKESKKIEVVASIDRLDDLPETYKNEFTVNFGLLCCFRLSKRDGDYFGPQMFRVDGRKIKQQTLQNIINKVEQRPQFELITDEEKLNIDRLIGQESGTYYCYRVGTIASVFHLEAPPAPVST